jgi:hypothetical protein
VSQPVRPSPPIFLDADPVATLKLRRDRKLNVSPVTSIRDGLRASAVPTAADDVRGPEG